MLRFNATEALFDNFELSGDYILIQQIIKATTSIISFVGIGGNILTFLTVEKIAKKHGERSGTELMKWLSVVDLVSLVQRGPIIAAMSLFEPNLRNKFAIFCQGVAYYARVVSMTCKYYLLSIPRLRCHPEVTSNQTKSNAYGVFPNQNCRVWDLVRVHNSMTRGHFGLGMV